MYVFLGFLDIALVAAVTSPLWVRKLNQWFFHKQGKGYTRLIKTLRALHKPLALALIIIIPVHGYLALGSLRMHTGLIAWIAALAAGALGVGFWLSKKKALLFWHRIAALVFVVWIAVHLLAPNLLYNLGAA